MDSVVPLGRKRGADTAFMEDKWSVIEDAVMCVLNGRRSKTSFQHIYQCVFQLCQAKHGAELTRTLTELFDAHVCVIVSTIQASSADTFLETVTEQLKRFRSALERLDPLLLFYNRTFAQSGHKPSALQLGESIVATALFSSESFLTNLGAQFCWRLQDASRWDSISAYSYEIVLLELGKWVKIGFEEPFLDALRGQYEAESSQRRASDSVGDYLNWVRAVVAHETSRVQDILNASFTDRVQHTLEHVLIAEQKEFILAGPGGVKDRLSTWDVASLSTTMDALAIVSEEDAVTEEVTRSVSNSCRAIFGESARSTAPAASENVIEHLVKLLQSVTLIISKLTSANNRARVLRTVEDGVNSCAELPDMLSVYVDHAMRTATGDALARLVHNAISVFKALRDNDVFETSYRNHLAARLMHATPEMIHTEKLFIANLKEEGSAANMARLEGMLSDVEASTAVNKRIADEIKQGVVKLPIEFQVVVLTNAFWPPIPAARMSLPRELELCESFFREHYLRRHNGRKLLFNLNTGNVVFVLRLPQRQYTVVAPTLYVHTILALNADAEITADDLTASSSLTRAELVSQLDVLDQAGLVTKSASGRYCFNQRFSSPRPRVKISHAAAAKVTPSSVDHSVRRNAAVQGSRISSLDAVIVKWLKREKTLHHDTLCENVVIDLKHIFTPTMPDIKARLSSLIERGFITRSTTEGYYVYCQ